MGIGGEMNLLATRVVRQDIIKEIPTLREEIKAWLNENLIPLDKASAFVNVDITGYITVHLFITEDYITILKPRLRSYFANFFINQSGDMQCKFLFSETVASCSGIIDQSYISDFVRNNNCWKLDLNFQGEA